MNAIKEKLKKNKMIYMTVRKIKYMCGYFIWVYCETFFFYARYFLKKIHILKTDKYVKSLKNKYLGEKIFVVATGPSLRLDILEELEKKNAITISVNGVFKIFDKTSWRPDYYVMDDYWLTKKYVEEYSNIRLDMIAKKGTVFSEKCKKYIPYAKEMKRTGYVPVCYYDHWYTHFSKHYGYNKEIDCGNFCNYTVTNFAINLADYMGASEVYLLGVDCNYTSSKQHIGESEIQLSDKDMKAMRETEMGMIMGYRMLRDRIGNNIKIYNVNKGGNVDAFQRIEWEEIEF